MEAAPARTSGKDHSIWKPLNENTFRNHILQLCSISKDVPVDPHTHTKEAWQKRSGRVALEDALIPFTVEKQLADDFAFLAAATEGAHSVSAAAIETVEDPQGLVIRLAANNGVASPVKQALTEMLDSLQLCGSGGDWEGLSERKCRTALFDVVIRLHAERIHGRLRSRYWRRPKHYDGVPKPNLQEELRKWIEKNAHAVSPTSGGSRTLLVALAALCDTYEIVDKSVDKTTADQNLRLVIRESYDLCTSGGKFSLEKTVEQAGLNPGEVCNRQEFRQVNSIGHYWGACVALSKLARRYSVFSKIALECLLPFQPVYSRVPDVSKPIPCHVHAEVQVLIFYELKSEMNTSIPSVIGTSKAACYLCDLFIKHHSRFLVTKTHGRIHSQWTVPDLKEFSMDSVKSLRRTIALVDQEIAAAKKRTVKRRPYPKESWLDIRLVPSLISGSSVETARPPATDEQKGSGGEHSENLSGQLLPVPGQIKAVTEGKESFAAASSLTPMQEAKDIESVGASGEDDAPNGSALRATDKVHPLGKHISPDFPCRFRSENGSVEIYVEIEKPSAGVASFEEGPIDSTSKLTDVLDIRTLEPSLLREYTVEDGSDEVTVKLLVEVDRLASLQLRWI